jgi:hypothetical protein
VAEISRQNEKGQQPTAGAFRHKPRSTSFRSPNSSTVYEPADLPSLDRGSSIEHTANGMKCGRCGQAMADRNDQAGQAENKGGQATCLPQSKSTRPSIKV